MSKVLIINYPILKLGGIEKYICSHIPFFLDNGVRVIWLMKDHDAIGKSFEKVLSDERIEKVTLHRPSVYWFRHDAFNLNKEDEIVIMSCRPMDMIRSFCLMRDFKDYNITPFYCVPDTKGGAYYLEGNFPPFIRKFLKKRLASAHYRWESYNLIRFFAFSQIHILEENYGLKVTNPDQKVLRSNDPYPEFNEDAVRELAEKRGDEFNIVTLGRFDFPHKGYMLGLIRSYVRLKSKYPQLKLKIVGYGPDKDKLLTEIDKVQTEYKGDITLVGEVAPAEIASVFKNMHLNISVAGAVRDGVRNSVLSIPARNYCEGECEVYGLNFTKMHPTSTLPGDLVDPYIEKVITMSVDEYVSEVKRMHDMYRNVPQPWFLFDTRKLCDKPMPILNSEIRFFKTLEFVKRIIYAFKFLLKK